MFDFAFGHGKILNARPQERKAAKRKTFLGPAKKGLAFAPPNAT
jgi:hypothetical protein